MKNNSYIKFLIISFVATLLFGISIGTVISYNSRKNSFKTISKIVGYNKELEKGVVDALKYGNKKDEELGIEILKRYGYSKKSLYDIDDKKLIIDSILFGAVLFVVIVIIIFKLHSSKIKRIQELTDYLYRINSGKYSSLIQTNEDDFSMLEDELYKTVNLLKQTKENAIIERQKLADNLADISHQLKTPITSMFLMTELLSDNEKNVENKIYIDKLNIGLIRLESLVSILLKLSKLDSNTLDWEKKEIDISALLSSAVEPIEQSIKYKKQKITIQKEPQVSMICDFGWTTEAILNLVKNCSEHTQEEGNITLSYSKNPIFVEIVVEDNGQGFNKEDIPYLFKRFYKGKNSNKKSFGIGLALTKAILKNQNATIKAGNKKSGGAKFILKFYNQY